MNVLVTGGFGYIGSRLLPELSHAGHRIHVAARGVPRFLTDLASQHEFYPWDLRKPWSGPPPAACDVVIHLAAANDIDCADAATALQDNALATRHALEFCQTYAVPRMIYVSTFQVYGAWEGVVDEDSVPLPLNDYAITHWFAEEYVRMFARRTALDYVILRPTNIYGAPAHREIDRWSLVPNCFCKEAYETGAITLRSSGLQQRDFISLATLAARIARVAGRPEAYRNNTYAVGSGVSITIRELAELASRRYEAAFGRPCELRVVSDEPHESRPLHVKGARSAEAGLLAPPRETASDEIDRIFDLLKGS
jgi:UDP-glucose 4-epimerase